MTFHLTFAAYCLFQVFFLRGDPAKYVIAGMVKGASDMKALLDAGCDAAKSAAIFQR